MKKAFEENIVVTMIALMMLGLLGYVFSVGTDASAVFASFLTISFGGLVVNQMTISRDKKSRREDDIAHIKSLMFAATNLKLSAANYIDNAMFNYDYRSPETAYLDIALNYGLNFFLEPITIDSFGYLFNGNADDVVYRYFTAMEQYELCKTLIDQYNEFKIETIDSLKVEGHALSREDIYVLARDLPARQRSKIIGAAVAVARSVRNLRDSCELLQDSLRKFAYSTWEIELKKHY